MFKRKKIPTEFQPILCNRSNMTHKGKDVEVINALIRFVILVSENARKGKATSAEIAALPEVAQVVIKAINTSRFNW